jgi:proteasome lid subunit RPN8/RPN11
MSAGQGPAGDASPSPVGQGFSPATERETLALAPGVAEAIEAHGREAFPHECCGALLGADGRVAAMFRLPNTTEEGPRRRFLVRPGDYQAAERDATTRGLDLLGFYHSHPDHPARPSQYDLDHAWPVFSYVIVSIMGGEPSAMTSWRLRDDRSAFVEQPLAREAAPIAAGDR